MIYRLSLIFVKLQQFLAKLRALDLVNFSNQTDFRAFFLNACRYCPGFWHGSQSPCLQIQFEFRYAPSFFGEITGLETYKISAMKQFSRLFFQTLADIDLIFAMEVNHHVLQIKFYFRYASLIFGEITDLGLSKFQ